MNAIAYLLSRLNFVAIDSKVLVELDNGVASYVCLGVDANRLDALTNCAV